MYPTKKSGTVILLSDIGKLNQRINRKTFPILKIQHILLKLEGFMHD